MNPWMIGLQRRPRAKNMTSNDQDVVLDYTKALNAYLDDGILPVESELAAWTTDAADQIRAWEESTGKRDAWTVGIDGEIYIADI